MNLAHLLASQAAERPTAPALIDGRGYTITYGELEERAARAAGLLRRCGIGPGDRALIFHPLAVDLYVAIAALLRVGAAALFVDPAQGRAHIDAACARLRPKALLATPKVHLLRLVSPELRRIPVQIATGIGFPFARSWRAWRQTPRDSNIQDMADDAAALITFTSGSTGAPKAAARSHAFLLAQHRALEKTLPTGPGDVVLTNLPIFVLSHLGSGACVTLPGVDVRNPGRVRAGPLVEQIIAQGVTCIEGSPPFVERIATACREWGVTLPALRKLYTGGGPVFPQLLDALRMVAPNAEVAGVYGSTEAEPITLLPAPELSAQDRARLSAGGGLPVGRPIDSIALRILPDRWGTPLGPFAEDEFDALALPPGKAGEIVVCGAHVLSGYLGGVGDDETKIRVCAGDAEMLRCAQHDSMEEGWTVWHRTGDAGYLDEDGRLWLLGRCAARIDGRGDDEGALYPFAVECAVREMAGVRQAALLALDGRRILALELERGAQPELPHSLRERLAWARIDEVRVLPRLPVDKRHNAKIDYPALRRLMERG